MLRLTSSVKVMGVMMGGRWGVSGNVVVPQRELSSSTPCLAKKKGKVNSKELMEQLAQELSLLPKEERLQSLIVDEEFRLPEKHEYPRWLPELLIRQPLFSELTPLDKKYHKMLRRSKIRNQNKTRSG